jgi:hypothetical protein
MLVNFFENNDIFEYTIPYIDINEYDKLKKVSSRFNNIFNLSYLINNKIYHKLMCINGCTQNNIMNIMEKNILSKYNFKKNKSILYDIKYCNATLINSVVHSTYSTIIENIIDLIYNTSHKNYRNLLKILKSVYGDSYITVYNNNDCVIITNSLKLCFNLFDNFDKYSLNTAVLYRLNISMYIFIMIKLLCNSINTHIADAITAIEGKKDSLKLLFMMQNSKLDEYKELIYNTQYTKVFPKYYKRSILELIDKLYITRELF